MDRWKLKEYGKVWTSFRAGCSKKMKDEFERRMDILSERGTLCGPPVTKKIEKGLFELRAKDRDNQARLLFIYEPNKTICFVHAFFKKTRTTPEYEKRIARRIKILIEQKGEKAHGINFMH